MFNFSRISVLSSFGHEINNLLVTNDTESDHLLALFPGMYNTCESPLLYYAREAALQAGCDVLGIQYGYSRAGVDFSPEMFAPTLEETLEALRLCGFEKYRRISFISKSFGTLIAGEAAKRFPTAGIRHLFLTPISSSIPYIAGTDCTVIYGTADPHFTQNDAAQIADDPRVKLHALPGADHSLESRTDYRDSLRVLAKICGIYEDFLKLICSGR